MVESREQTAGYRFISRAFALPCIGACTDEIHAGSGRGGKKKKRKRRGEERRGPERVLNV